MPRAFFLKIFFVEWLPATSGPVLGVRDPSTRDKGPLHPRSKPAARSPYLHTECIQYRSSSSICGSSGSSSDSGSGGSGSNLSYILGRHPYHTSVGPRRRVEVINFAPNAHRHNAIIIIL